MVHVCLVYFRRTVLLDSFVMHTNGGGPVSQATSQATHMRNQSILLCEPEAIDIGYVPIGMYGSLRNRPGRSTTQSCYGCVSLETQLYFSFPFARNRECTLAPNPRPRTAESSPATAGGNQQCTRLWKAKAQMAAEVEEKGGGEDN